MAIRLLWRWLSAQTLRGLLLLVPIVVSVQFLVWLARTLETQLQPVVTLLLPATSYFPGLAVLLFLISAFVVGVLTRHILMRKVVLVLESWLEKIPVIGSIYPVVRQLTDLLTDRGKENGKVVLVELPGGQGQAIGLVMLQGGRDRIDWLPQDCDLVYLPMSYQVGGYSLVLPRDRLRPLDMKMGEALQMIVMGGVAQGNRDNNHA
ncbi:MAG: DUF502 domain-containing protein [Spongiibacteraceae bacterium]